MIPSDISTQWSLLPLRDGYSRWSPGANNGATGEDATSAIISMRHVRHYWRKGEQSRQHHPVKRVPAKRLRALDVPGTTEDSSLMQEGIMEIVLQPSSRHNNPKGDFQNKGALLNTLIPDSRTSRYLRGGRPSSSANIDGMAASIVEPDYSSRYARPECSFNQRTYKLVRFPVECFGPMGNEGVDLLVQVASHVVAKAASTGHREKRTVSRRMR